MSEQRSVFDAVRTMLAVRDYQDRAVPEPLVRRILEAGRLTASSMNQQPWHFIVIEDPAEIAKLAAGLRTGPYLSGAPLAIAVAIPKGSPYAMSDASRAIQSMLLTAWAEGVGSNWIGFGGLASAKKLLAVPAEMDVLAVLAFGYPARRVGGTKKKRKPLSEVASRDRFGAPYRG